MCVKQDESSHQHNTDEQFGSLLEDAKNRNQNGDADSSSDSRIDSDEDLSDKYQLEEQKNRSRSISTILHHYEQSYSSKASFQRSYRKLLFWGASIIVLLFVLAILFVLIYAMLHSDSLEIAGVATIVTTIVSLVISILELVRIIIKYCFPENDDEYIVRIVETIQMNDLEKTKESNRAAEAKQNSSPSE